MKSKATNFNLILGLFIAINISSAIGFKVKRSANIDPRCQNFSYIEQKIDQYSFAHHHKFYQRYIINKDHWKPGNPIFFYCGNEADITTFCNTMGFIWDTAKEFEAMVVFAEHRYYGESLPFGFNSLTDYENMKYLTPEQALVDYANLINFIKANTTGAKSSKVVAIGGSYGGMLATWMRVKYPHMIVGAYASSAPLLLHKINCNDFNDYITQKFTKYNSSCSEAIRQSWSIFNELDLSAAGWEQIYNTFNLCRFRKYSLTEFKEWLKMAYELIAMSDYPYAYNQFTDLPAWPVKEICQKITDGLDMSNKTNVIEHIYQGVNVFLNSSANRTCLTVGELPTNMPKAEETAANYQWCTAIYFPFCANGKSDMFEPIPWDFNRFSDACYHKYGVRPIENWISTQYGDDELMGASNIAFTNGDLDPYIVGGIQKPLSDSVVSYTIKDAAHHLDLLHANANDPITLIDTRVKIKERIREWLSPKTPSFLTSSQTRIESQIMVVLATIFSKLKIF